ncbi:MAG: glutamate racemase [Elusimicrobia bacterium RIFCSPLOWO2_01_FULL_59_12]|nr:MAG: glutamate racemase [Elusimicrobia bacterium RIFCSPLOWO2_01_FULL_59_12]
MANDLPIGMFDSGVGGLTVLREVMAQLPRESTVYFGDTARVPYGSKSRDVIVRFSLEIGQFLIQEKVKMIVVACNTASAFALPALSSKFDLPIVGVIAPGAQAALQATKSRRVGVIGTEGTIESQAYTEAIRALDPRIEVFGQACPLIVPLVEEGWLDKPVASEIVKEYLAPLLTNRIDTLVLGCTHYPLLKGLLSNVTGPQIQLIDSAQETARAVARRLKEGHLEASASSGPAVRRFYVSDAPGKFEKIGRRFLGQDLPGVKLVDIGAWL